eukprot:scaffold21681_cov27-Tisochrysis_lutea.AAC.1
MAQILDQCAKIWLAQALVSVSKNREADGHIRMGIFRRLRWRVLAHERHCEISARPRKRKVTLHGDHLFHREKAKMNPRNLAKHVGQQKGEPVRA